MLVATSVTGNVKDILATFVGAAAFRDFIPTPYSVSGITVSFIGAAAFSWAKLSEMRAAPTTSGSAQELTPVSPSAGLGNAVDKSTETSHAPQRLPRSSSNEEVEP